VFSEVYATGVPEGEKQKRQVVRWCNYFDVPYKYHTAVYELINTCVDEMWFNNGKGYAFNTACVFKHVLLDGCTKIQCKQKDDDNLLRLQLAFDIQIKNLRMGCEVLTRIHDGISITETDKHRQTKKKRKQNTSDKIMIHDGSTTNG